MTARTVATSPEELRAATHGQASADTPYHLHLLELAAAEIERLERENAALRNLAENLRPGPISEALAGAADETSAAPIGRPAWCKAPPEPEGWSFISCSCEPKKCRHAEKTTACRRNHE